MRWWSCIFAKSENVPVLSGVMNYPGLASSIFVTHLLGNLRPISHINDIIESLLTE